MKRTQLLVLSVLALGLQGVAQASRFPADAEWSAVKPALASYSEQHPGGNSTSSPSAFPADAEASITLPARSSYVERHAGDAVKERAQPSIAFLNLDD